MNVIENTIANKSSRRGSLAGSPAVGTTKSDAPLALVIEALAGATNDLGVTLGRLEEILQPVMTSMPCPQTQAEEKASVCSVYDALSTLEGRLNRYNIEVKHILERLCV